jgi:hypothetical protein
MQKFLIPAALAVAMTAGGTAFAESAKGSIDYSLYEETAPFASQAAPTGTGVDYLRAAKRGEQRASTAPVPSQGWDKETETARPRLEQPE